MKEFTCKKCGNNTYTVISKKSGTGTEHGLYCDKCGFWHKWISKDELKDYLGDIVTIKQNVVTITKEENIPRERFNEFIQGLNLKDTDKLIVISIGDFNQTKCSLYNISAIDLTLAKQELEFQIIGNFMKINKETFRRILDGKTV